MSYASHLVESYFRRAGQPQGAGLDAAYQYQMAVLRDMVSRLEVILDDEGVPRETAIRVIRCMLYGAPSAADAELRMRQDEEMARLLASTAPIPLHLPPDAQTGHEVAGALHEYVRRGGKLPPR